MGWQHVVGSFDAVILDHDGTIVDSHAAMLRAYATWAEEFDVDLEKLPTYLGMPSRALTKALVAEDRWSAAAIRIEELEVTDTAGVAAMPGAAETMAAAGLPLPRVVVTRDQVANGKPAPDSFLLAAEQLGVEPSRALVVEDSLAGIAAARAGGFPVLGILSTHSPDVLHADVHVPDLSQVTWEVTHDGIRAVVAWGNGDHQAT